MPPLIDAMEQALIDFSAGRVSQPARQVLPVKAHRGYLLLMPAISESMGVKIVTFYPENQSKGLHTHHALIMVLDTESGEPGAVLDGRLITEMRTAVVSAAATRLLASENASTLAILGSGVQARSHVEAIRCVRDIDDVRVGSRDPLNAARFATEVRATAMSAREAVEGAAIVVTATAATESVLEGKWLSDGVHVNAVGWNGPDGRELDDDAMSSLVFVDSRQGAADEAGNILCSAAKVTAEIGAVLAAPLSQWRSEKTVFDSVGMAVEGVVAAQWFSIVSPADSLETGNLVVVGR
jgi:ornithine cyclodeaminase/alanine dehydrogenase-like protein (mu-crystallin family)